MRRQDGSQENQLDNQSSFLPLSITSCKSRDEAGKLVNHLYHEGVYYLCFSYGLYAGTSVELNTKVEFPLNGPFVVNYVIIPKFKSSSMVNAVSFCHLLMFSDSTIKGFKFKNNKFLTIYNSNVAPKLNNISSPTSKWLNASINGTLYTCNNMSYQHLSHNLGANIYSFDFRNGLVETFYVSGDEEIISFDFINRERLVDDLTYPGKSDVYFICLLKCDYSENMILEAYHRAGNHDTRKLDFNGQCRFNLLPISDDEFCYMKIICDHTIIVLTNTYTQVVKLGKKGFEGVAFFNNKGLPKEDGHEFLKDSYDMIYKKSAFYLTIFDVHSNKYSAKIHPTSLEVGQVHKNLQWSKERIFKLPKHDLCDAVLQLPGKKYIALTRMNGINFISNNHRGPAIEKVNGSPLYTNKVYLTSQVARNKGTDIDSLLLGGSFNSERGFLERKSLAYDDTLLERITSVQVPLNNVTDFWITDLMADGDDHFIYESMGSVYKNGALTTDEPYDCGIFVTRTGEILENNMDGSTGDIKQIDMLQSDHNSPNLFYYPIENSSVRISKFEPKSNSLHKAKDVFIEGIDSSDSVISCCLDGVDTILFSVYSEGNIAVWDASQNKVASSCPDYSFIACDLLMKKSWVGKNSEDNSTCVIASTYIGCVRVYKSESNSLRVALEIHSPYGLKLEILDTTTTSPLVFFYNEKETFLLNLDNLTYGSIQLGVIPRRMRIRPEKELFSLYVLDNECQIHMFYFGTTFDRGNLSKQIISLKPQVNNYMHPLPRVPVQLYAIPNCPNQAIICLVDTNNGQYELMLFDYLLMKSIYTFIFPNVRCSHAVMKPLWSEDDSIYSSISYFYGNKFIVCLGIDEKRTKISLFEIRDSEIVELYANCLEDRIFSVFIYYEGLMVLFSGDNGIVPYKINMLRDGSKMLEACSFPVIETIDAIGLPAYINGNYFVQFETLKGFVRTHLPTRASLEYPSEYLGETCMSAVNFGSIVQVATKTINKKRMTHKNDHSENRENLSISRLSSLARVEVEYSGRSYVATISSDNILAIYEDSEKSLVDEDGLFMPYLKIRLPDKIISLTPIPDGFCNLQICSSLNNERLEGVLPLFMLCGTAGQIYIVSEFLDELWMKSLLYYKEIKLDDEKTVPSVETSMRNATGQYALSDESGINESGFEELGRNLKRAHIDHLPYKTIDFFDPAKLRKVTRDFV